MELEPEPEPVVVAAVGRRLAVVAVGQLAVVAVGRQQLDDWPWPLIRITNGCCCGSPLLFLLGALLR